jgi:hypothetical protein
MLRHTGAGDDSSMAQTQAGIRYLMAHSMKVTLESIMIIILIKHS